MSSKEKTTREIILYTYQQNKSLSKNAIAKKLKVPKSTVYDVINRFEQHLTVERAAGSGRPRGAKFPEVKKAAIKAFKANPNVSGRDLACKLNVSEKTIRKYKNSAGLKTYVAAKVPKRSEKQEITAKTRARKLYAELLTKFDCVLMDDETYVKTDFKQLPGKKFYVATGRGQVKENYKEVRLEKYASKFMVWQAICSCGKKTEPFVTQGTINSEIYIKECLEKRVLPFVRKHNGSVLFWPDLATSHYAKKTLEWYQCNNIQFVPKTHNPPNTPILRPIERFWAQVKRELKKKGGMLKMSNILQDDGLQLPIYVMNRVYKI